MSGDWLTLWVEVVPSLIWHVPLRSEFDSRWNLHALQKQASFDRVGLRCHHTYVQCTMWLAHPIEMCSLRTTLNISSQCLWLHRNWCYMCNVTRPRVTRWDETPLIICCKFLDAIIREPLTPALKDTLAWREMGKQIAKWIFWEGAAEYAPIESEYTPRLWSVADKC